MEFLKSRLPQLVLIVGVLLIFLFVTGIISPVGLFNLILLQPMLNFLVILSRVFGGSFGVAIIVLTIVVMLLLMPVHMSQLRSTKAFQELQPRIKELQAKYKKDREKLQKEQMKLLKESGVNPAGCMFTQFIQFPVWIGIYQSVIQGIAVAPENLLGLSKQLYPSSFIQEAVPLNSSFLWFDLGQPDMIMAVLGGLSMWLLQRMSMPVNLDPSQQSTQTTMQIAMPIFFIVFGFLLPAGLPLYWVASSAIRIVMQYRATGWGSLRVPAFVGRYIPWLAPSEGQASGTSANTPSGAVSRQPQTAAEAPVEVEGEATAKDSAPPRRRKVRDGKHRSKRKDRRRGGGTGSR